MLHAEKKYQMGEVDWSPDFQAGHDKLEVQNLVVRFQQDRRIKPSRICRVARKVGIVHVSPLGCSLAEAIWA